MPCPRSFEVPNSEFLHRPPLFSFLYQRCLSHSNLGSLRAKPSGPYKPATSPTQNAPESYPKLYLRHEVLRSFANQKRRYPQQSTFNIKPGEHSSVGVQLWAVVRRWPQTVHSRNRALQGTGHRFTEGACL